MWHELLDLALVLLVVALVAIGAWAAVHPPSSAAGWVAWASRRAGGPRRLAVVLVAAILFAAVAEDVLWRDDEDWVLTLDRQADVVGRGIGRNPVIHRVALAISFATGAGLVAALVAAGGMLVWTGRRRAAFTLLLGTAGGWLAGIAFKLVFRVPRPGHSPEYGFPSGHTFVTLIAVGLFVWLCSRRLSRRLQISLYALGLAVAVLTGASRIVLHAHWLSDIVASLALGSLYLAVATSWSETDSSAATRHAGRRREPASRPR